MSSSVRRSVQEVFERGIAEDITVVFHLGWGENGCVLEARAIDAVYADDWVDVEDVKCPNGDRWSSMMINLRNVSFVTFK